MAGLSASEVGVGAWLCTMVGAVVALLTATVLPRWVTIVVDVRGVVDELDVGLWQICQSNNDSSFYNCTMLDSAEMTGWYQNVQITSTASCVTSICCSALLCLLLIRFECWRIKPHLMLHLLIAALQLAAGLLMLTSVILCGVNIPHQLPVCTTYCPPDAQPMTSCPASRVPSTTHCLLQSASAYVTAAAGSGLSLTSGIVGTILSSQLNGDDGEPLLDGISDVIVRLPDTDGYMTD